MNKQIALSYLRHLLTTAFATVLVVVNTQHVGLTNITKAQLFIIANAVWIAILPQLRFTIEPAVNLYLRKKFPSLGLVIDDLKVADATPASTPPASTPPAVVPGA